VEVPDQSLGRVIRTRRLRVRVGSRVPARVILVAHARRPLILALGIVRFRRPGTKRMHLDLTYDAASMLRGRARARVSVSVADFPSISHEATASRVLRR